MGQRTIANGLEYATFSGYLVGDGISRQSAMKKIAITVLLLFAASLFGGALASACAAPAHAAPVHNTQAQVQSSCCVDEACPHGSCVDALHQSCCVIDHALVAVAAERKQPANAFAKAPEHTSVAALPVSIGQRPTGIRFQRSAAPAHVGYRAIYARTGRLLI